MQQLVLNPSPILQEISAHLLMRTSAYANGPRIEGEKLAEAELMGCDTLVASVGAADPRPVSAFGRGGSAPGLPGRGVDPSAGRGIAVAGRDCACEGGKGVCGSGQGGGGDGGVISGGGGHVSGERERARARERERESERESER